MTRIDDRINRRTALVQLTAGAMTASSWKTPSSTSLLRKTQIQVEFDLSRNAERPE
jgi:hypothetical protein